MAAFTFVHCADLHLDAPFEGLAGVAPPGVREALRQATFRAFDQVVSLAVAEQAAFLVIAGDVYDSAHHSLYAQIRFREAVKRAAAGGVEVFVAHGNHDPLSAWEARLRLPEGVHRFGGEAVECRVVGRGGAELARVCGISFPVREVRENLAARFPRREPGPFTVGVLHANVGGNPAHDNYAPCSLADLEACGVDYVALGHVHAPQVLRQEGPCVVYAGTTQGRNLRETGPRGCFVVQVEEGGRLRPRFVPTDVVRWSLEDLDIGGLASLDDLLEALQARREELRRQAEGRGVIWRLNLTGRGELHDRLSRLDPERELAEPLREGEGERPDFVWLESVALDTRPVLDLERRRQLPDFLGEVLRVGGSLRSPEFPRELLEVLRRRGEFRHLASLVHDWTPPDWQAVLAAAEYQAVDLLLREEEG
ncbi:MAG: DNA repair exonuclease [Syntrophobacterales bacterium]|nr:DNA repair exonuclease [Syntrophobacterales bacterium]